MARQRQDELLRSATFVFIGTVRQTAASAMPEVAPDAHTAIVEIENVLVAPPAFKSKRGVVTLALPPEQPLQSGATRAFYCTTWKLGSGLALRCLDHRAARQTQRLLHSRLAAASVNVHGADLRTRLDGAELVATGVVVAIGPGPVQQGPISEHDPHWQEATIRVESVTKGEAPAKELSLYYPGTQDVAWHGAPRPQVGQRGVWALRSAPAADATAKTARGLQALPPKAYTALHPLDFQQETALPAIRALMQARPAAARRRPLKGRS
jgi:hypothetical protein